MHPLRSIGVYTLVVVVIFYCFIFFYIFLAGGGPWSLDRAVLKQD